MLQELRPILAATATVVSLVTDTAFLVIPRIVEAVQRSREKRTMHTILRWSLSIEPALSRPPVTEQPEERRQRLRAVTNSPTLGIARLDAWGTPLAIHITSSGYEIRSAAADRRFDEVVLEGEKTSFEQDLVFANGTYIQFPAGSFALPAGYDPTPKPPTVFVLSNCRRCHGGRHDR